MTGPATLRGRRRWRGARGVSALLRHLSSRVAAGGAVGASAIWRTRADDVECEEAHPFASAEKGAGLRGVGPVCGVGKVGGTVESVGEMMARLCLAMPRLLSSSVVLRM